MACSVISPISSKLIWDGIKSPPLRTEHLKGPTHWLTCKLLCRVPGKIMKENAIVPRATSSQREGSFNAVVERIKKDRFFLESLFFLSLSLHICVFHSDCCCLLFLLSGHQAVVVHNYWAIRDAWLTHDSGFVSHGWVLVVTSRWVCARNNPGLYDWTTAVIFIFLMIKTSLKYFVTSPCPRSVSFSSLSNCPASLAQ